MNKEKLRYQLQEIITQLEYAIDEEKVALKYLNGNGSMKTFILKRVATNEDGMFGVLQEGDTPFALTVERKWLDNQKNISCIPEGQYVCERVTSPKFGNTFEVTDVENRNHILFHKGNIMDDSHGCIIVGEQFESLNSKTAVLASSKGFSEFLFRTTDTDQFRLIIRNLFY